VGWLKTMTDMKTFIEEEIYWRIVRFWEKVRYFPREIKWFIQRGKRGYSDSDIWGFHDYLRQILAKGLKQLAKNTHGWPDIDEAKTYKDWQKILRTMAEGFQAVIDYDEKVYFNKKKMDNAYEKQTESLKLLAKWFDHLWD